MTRQLEAIGEQRQAKRHALLVRALEFELSGALQASGATLLGFSVKIEEWECLMTLRAYRDDSMQIAFVGSDDVINCINKAVRAAKSGKIVWREDKWRANGG